MSLNNLTSLSLAKIVVLQGIDAPRALGRSCLMHLRFYIEQMYKLSNVGFPSVLCMDEFACTLDPTECKLRSDEQVMCGPINLKIHKFLYH